MLKERLSAPKLRGSMDCCRTHPDHHDGHCHAGPETPELAAAPRRSALFARFSKFFVWWLIFSGIYAGSSVCPFCGRMGCPVGGASAGLVGGFFAVLLLAGKRLWAYCKNLLSWTRSALGTPKTGHRGESRPLDGKLL
jgi:hypothetical protein